MLLSTNTHNRIHNLYMHKLIHTYISIHTQGLELSIDRLKSLFKFAFGLGTLQVLLCTAAFTAVPYFGGAQLLEWMFNADP